MIAEENMNATIKLLKLLGSPFSPATTYMLDRIELMKLYRCSRKNRILFLYLETINKMNVEDFSTLYQEEKLRYLKTDDAIAKASRVLTDAHIKHSLFKTIRPYRSTTVDLDILIFGDRNCIKSVKAMQKAGYKIVVYGPRSTTLWDKEANIGIDLYEQVAVSFITYMDKQKLISYVTTIMLPNGEYVKTLKPEANLACIIAHSIIKEQMYTLSEYYTFIHYLKQMNINDFLKIVKQNNIAVATRTHATITALLHKTAHNTIPEKLQQILNSLGQETFETTLLIKKDFKTPHKYKLLTLVRSLLEIANVKKCRRSFAGQILHMLGPRFTKDFLRDLMKHILRETY